MGLDDSWQVAATRAAQVAGPQVPEPLSGDEERVVAEITRLVSDFVAALFADHGETLEAAMARAAQEARPNDTQSSTEGEFKTPAGKVWVNELPDRVVWQMDVPLGSANSVGPPFHFVVTSNGWWWFQGTDSSRDWGHTGHLYGHNDQTGEFEAGYYRPHEHHIKIAQTAMAGWLMLAGIIR